MTQARIFNAGFGLGMSLVLPGVELTLVNYGNQGHRTYGHRNGRLVIMATFLFDTEGFIESEALPGADLDWETCAFCPAPYPERVLHERDKDDSSRWFAFVCCQRCYEENWGRNGAQNYR